MNLHFTPDEERFREQIRAFLEAELPQRLSQKVRAGQRITKADMELWHAILNARGWLASHWPREHGGPGWSPTERFIFELEASLAYAPRLLPFGINMLGPVLIRYGSAAQKDYWLPRILNGNDWWCQGYSEPGAGSDLASLSTSATRDGDHYIVNGQKTWTTLGQYANMMFCLVRTSSEGKKQEGISFLLVDMNSPGIEVRPIQLLDGECEVNEVFLTDVRVPAENLVGEENKGWTYAKYLLTYERTNIAGVGGSYAAFHHLAQVARTLQRGGRPLIENAYFAARMAKLEIALDNLRTTNLRVLAASTQGAAPGAQSSMLKILGTEIRQEISSLTRRAFGTYALPFAADRLDDTASAPEIGPKYSAAASAQYFNNRKLSIFGGSNEIQREVIAREIMGVQ